MLGQMPGLAVGGDPMIGRGWGVGAIHAGDHILSTVRSRLGSPGEAWT
jgi:hypothetical protein